MDNKNINEEIFEYKMYITDLETNKKSKEINVSDLVFNDYIEFEFGNYEDEDYETLPYKDFKFFINDYAVTFYSPQCEKMQQELDQYKNILEDIDKYIHNFKIENIGEKTMLILNDILLIKNGLDKDVIRLNKIKELEEDK